MFHVIVYGLEAAKETFAENREMTLKSIKDHFYFPHNLTVVSPGGINGVFLDQLVSKFLIKYEHIESGNIPETMNAAIRNSGAQTKYILIMAVGMILSRNLDQRFHQTINSKTLAAAAFKIVDRNDSIIHAGNDKDVFPFTRYYLQKDRNSFGPAVERVSRLPMEFILMRRDAFNAVGDFSTDFPQFGWEGEWCKRALEKKQCLYYIPVKVLLMGPISTVMEKHYRDLKAAQEKVPEAQEKESAKEEISIKASGKRGRPPGKRGKAHAR